MIEMRIRKGIDLVTETVGQGPEIERKKFYRMGLRLWLHKGDALVWNSVYGIYDEDNKMQLLDNGHLLISNFQYHRAHLLFNALFYGIEGMRIGGVRKIRIAPHLAFGEQGIEGFIPPNALLTVEINIIKEIFFS